LPSAAHGSDPGLVVAGGREGPGEVARSRGWSNARIAEALGAQDQVVTRLLSDIYRKVGSDQAGLPRLIGMQGGASPTPHD
jgi:hypothetical protein